MTLDWVRAAELAGFWLALWVSGEARCWPIRVGAVGEIYESFIKVGMLEC